MSDRAAADGGEHPLVSVVLPVYNGSRHLGAAIDSVLSQEVADLELVAVDDGSTDDSWDLLEQYRRRDERVRPIRLAANAGHAVASNTAIEAARGSFITRQDQDDVWLPGLLSRAVGALQAQPELGVVATSYFRWLPDGRRLRRNPPRSHTALRAAMLFGNAMLHAGVTVRAALRETGELHYRPLPGPQDYDLWIRLLRITKGTTIDEPLVLYRQHEGTMSALYETEQPVAAKELGDAQLRALLPELAADDELLAALRAAYSRRFDDPAARAAVPTLFKVWDALSQSDDIDPADLRGVRRQWLRRSYSALARSSNRVALRDRRFVAELVRRDAWAPVIWAQRDLGPKVAARLRRRHR